MRVRKLLPLKFRGKKYTLGALNTIQTITLKSRMAKALGSNNETECLDIMVEVLFAGIMKPKQTKKMIAEDMDCEDMQDLFLAVGAELGLIPKKEEKGKPTKAEKALKKR